MYDNLIIIGASGHGKVVVDIAINMNKWKSVFFLDDNNLIKQISGFDVIGNINDSYKYRKNSDFFVAIGNNKIREEIQNELVNKDFNLISLIHPSAILGNDVYIGKGSVIMAGVIVNSDSKIGDGCIINTGATVDHDNLLGDYTHVSPGVNLAGAVEIGKGTWIGIGSVVSNSLKITNGCIIGAGAVVVNSLNEVGTYVGIPARRI